MTWSNGIHLRYTNLINVLCVEGEHIVEEAYEGLKEMTFKWKHGKRTVRIDVQ